MSKSYINAVSEIRDLLLSPNFLTGRKNSNDVALFKKLFDDIGILENNSLELTDSQSVAIRELHKNLKKYFSSYIHNKPEEIPLDQLKKSLITTSDWFIERYKYVNGSPTLQRLFKKFGCDALFGKAIDVGGANVELKGPAIIAVTHHIMIENAVIQTITDQNINWVSDPIGLLGHFMSIRQWKVPLLGRVFKNLGMLEINRKKPSQIRELVRQSTLVLEKGGLVGIMPSGAPDSEAGMWDNESGGAIFIAKHAAKTLGHSIKIIRIAVLKDGKRLRVIFGEPLFVSDNVTDYSKFANVHLIDYLENIIKENSPVNVSTSNKEKIVVQK